MTRKTRLARTFVILTLLLALPLACSIPRLAADNHTQPTPIETRDDGTAFITLPEPPVERCETFDWDGTDWVRPECRLSPIISVDWLVR